MLRKINRQKQESTVKADPFGVEDLRPRRTNYRAKNMLRPLKLLPVFLPGLAGVAFPLGVFLASTDGCSTSMSLSDSLPLESCGGAFFAILAGVAVFAFAFFSVFGDGCTTVGWEEKEVVRGGGGGGGGGEREKLHFHDKFKDTIARRQIITNAS